MDRKSRMIRVAQFTVPAVALLAVAGCAAGSNPLKDSPESAGFWLGVWHGMICPIALVVSWFNQGVSIYEVHNNGGWYNTGFVLGAGAWGILRSSGSRKRKWGRSQNPGSVPE